MIADELAHLGINNQPRADFRDAPLEHLQPVFDVAEIGFIFTDE